MGVLKLSTLDEQYNAQRTKMRMVSQKGKHQVSACSCPCECFIKKGEIRMDIGETATWNID